jgi:hypothetical protein
MRKCMDKEKEEEENRRTGMILKKTNLLDVNLKAWKRE